MVLEGYTFVLLVIAVQIRKTSGKFLVILGSW